MIPEQKSVDWFPRAIAHLAVEDPSRLRTFLEEFAEVMPDAHAFFESYRYHAPDEDESYALVQADANGTARIVDSQVPVWEIVRAFRKLGSVDALKAKYVGLSERELRTALLYAGRFPDEISAQIARYEEFKSAQSQITFGAVDPI